MMVEMDMNGHKHTLPTCIYMYLSCMPYRTYISAYA